MLPEDFCERMRQMLGEQEYQAFLQSYDQNRYQGLRWNPLKTTQDAFAQRSGFHLKPVPWSPYGCYYASEDTPGKHPYHDAGVYYMQEPSAMAPAAYLAAQPGERVLDLCAAPGGKSTQIAADLRGEGLLVANEIHPARAKILSENMERMGIANAVVVNGTPQQLRRQFGTFFHRIMVDAPCSGEGMFRKQEEAMEEWSPDNVRMCGERQDEILEEAYHMLLPGGRLVYSTCTFAPDENEGSISRFVGRHPDMQIEPVAKAEGMCDGNPQWYENFAAHGCEDAPEITYPVAPGIADTIRLWPHRLPGEGHFVAVLRKDGPDLSDREQRLALEAQYPYKLEKVLSYQSCKELQKFAEDNLTDAMCERLQKGAFLAFGDQWYLVPPSLPSLKGLKVLRPGLHLGTLKKNRMEPSHALALHLHPDQVKRNTDLDSRDDTVRRYLSGETFLAQGDAGWHLISVDGYSLGWGKLTGTTMKNHYPKGLRKFYQ